MCVWCDQVENFKPKRGNTRAFICKMLRDRRFWRLTVFVLLVIAVRTLFRCVAIHGCQRCACQLCDISLWLWNTGISMRRSRSI